MRPNMWCARTVMDPVLFRMLSQETTENIKWILEVLHCYINDVFGGAETVLVDKD